MPTHSPTPRQPMFTPDSPEALFEALCEPAIAEFYPDFDELKPRNQKLIRLLHTELIKGELTDVTFQEFVGFTLLLWRGFNGSVLMGDLNQIDTEDEIDTEWVGSAIQRSRTEQFVGSLLALLDTMPGTEDVSTAPSVTRYHLERGLDS